MPKILLVEDEPNNTEIVLRTLQMNRYDVVTAVDGPTAVSLAVSERPDLILMDMGLPEREDGQKATREIRGRSGMESVPIIGLSAYCMANEVAEMRRAGCTDFVKKPIDLDNLLERIKKLLPASVKR